VKHSLVVALLVAVVLSLGQPSQGGNLSLIEKRLEELDRLNREAVQKAGKIPQNGSVDITARVLPGRAVTAPGVTETRFDFGKKTITAIDEKQPLTIQISASRSKEQSFKVANMLRRTGYPAFTASLQRQGEEEWHRIFVGSFARREEAEQVKQALEQDQISDTLIRNMPYAIQVGTAGSHDDLREIKDQVAAIKYLPYMGSVRDTADNQSRSRLLVGAFESREEAAALLDELRRTGFEARIVNR
jgi:cell division septation protein DedD